MKDSKMKVTINMDSRVLFSEKGDKSLMQYFRHYMLKNANKRLDMETIRQAEVELYSNYNEKIRDAENRADAISKLVGRLADIASDSRLFDVNGNFTGKVLYQSSNKNGTVRTLNFYMKDKVVDAAICEPGVYVPVSRAQLTDILNAVCQRINETDIVLAAHQPHADETHKRFSEIIHDILSIQDTGGIGMLIGKLSRQYAIAQEIPARLMSHMEDAAAALFRARNAILTGNVVNISYDGSSIYFACNNVMWAEEFECSSFGDIFFSGHGIGEGSNTLHIRDKETFGKLIASFCMVPIECRQHDVEATLKELYDAMDDDAVFHLSIRCIDED